MFNMGSAYIMWNTLIRCDSPKGPIPFETVPAGELTLQAYGSYVSVSPSELLAAVIDTSPYPRINLRTLAWWGGALESRFYKIFFS